MRKLAVPYTKDNLLVDKLGDEAKYIKEIYMPIPYDIIPSGRPMMKMEVDEYSKIFENQIQKIKAMGIEVTLLASKVFIDPGNCIRTIDKAAREIIRLRETYGIDKVVIGNSVFLSMHGEELKSHGIKIELSTMTDIDCVEKVKQIMTMNPFIDSICLNNTFIYNRDEIAYIREVYPNLGIKLLVNHGCLVNCVSHIVHHHYLSSIFIEREPNNPELDKLMAQTRYIVDSVKTCERCSQRNSINFLKESAYIRPEDLHLYDDLVDTFKFAGREHQADSIIQMIKAYGERKYDGMLFDIMDMPYHPEHQVDNSKFPEGFGEKRTSCEHKCYKCGYCDSVLEQVAILPGPTSPV